MSACYCVCACMRGKWYGVREKERQLQTMKVPSHDQKGKKKTE